MERLAREIPADDSGWLQLQMQFAFLRGDFSKFRSLSETAGEPADPRGRDGKRRRRASCACPARILSRKLCRGAQTSAATLEKANNDSATELWRCAEAFADAGDMTQAEALAAKLDRMAPEDTIEQKVYLPLIRSIIERQRGNPAKAADLLAKAKPYDYSLDVSYQLAQAYLAAGEPAKAAAEFEKLLDRSRSGLVASVCSTAQLGLARAYAMQGEREKSRKAYDDFFTTWKDADPNIPILRQAKAEYKKLTATPSAATSASGKLR